MPVPTTEEIITVTEYLCGRNGTHILHNIGNGPSTFPDSIDQQCRMCGKVFAIKLIQDRNGRVD